MTIHAQFADNPVHAPWRPLPIAVLLHTMQRGACGAAKMPNSLWTGAFNALSGFSSDQGVCPGLKALSYLTMYDALSPVGQTLPGNLLPESPRVICVAQK